MAGRQFMVPVGMDVEIPLVWKVSGNRIQGPENGTLISSTDTTVVSGGTVNADNSAVVLHTVGDGIAAVTIVSGMAEDTVDIVVHGNAQPIRLFIDVDKALGIRR
jgi:hypothetical protein